MDKKNRPKVLAVDDEQSSLNAINRTLRRDFDVFLSLNGHSALEILKNEDIDVILSDQRMPEMSGVAFLHKAQKIRPNAVRILITGYTDIETVVEAINEGRVFYYINKPWEPDELRMIMRRAAEHGKLEKENRRLMQELASLNQQLQEENTLLHKEVERQYSFDNIIGTSSRMENVFRLLRKVIPTTTSVLILGETGTGKELIARSIHYNGPRKDKRFAAQNCGALPDTLLESELFGHVKGAFTGAMADKKGLFELADGGTVFLDEVSDTSPAMQQRLLRVLQEGEIHPLGSEKTIKVDVRIISAANRNLEDAIHAGEFREDLFYRLNVFPIHLPPLRERREDVPLLANFFLEKFTKKMGKNDIKFSADSLSWLMTAEFPGNVRQLENLVERAVTLADDDVDITPDLLEMNGGSLRRQQRGNPLPALGDSKNLKEIVEAMEKYYIDQTMQEFKGNISKTAEKLGLSRLGLHKKLQRYGIEAANYKQR